MNPENNEVQPTDVDAEAPVSNVAPTSKQRRRLLFAAAMTTGPLIVAGSAQTAHAAPGEYGYS